MKKIILLTIYLFAISCSYTLFEPSFMYEVPEPLEQNAQEAYRICKNLPELIGPPELIGELNNESPLHHVQWLLAELRDLCRRCEHARHQVSSDPNTVQLLTELGTVVHDCENDVEKLTKYLTKTESCRNNDQHKALLASVNKKLDILLPSAAQALPCLKKLVESSITTKPLAH